MTSRKLVTKRAVLSSFTVHVFYRMEPSHHIRRFTKITCCDAGHDSETDNTITWLYHTWLTNRYGNGMTKDHTAYICSRCAYRTIRAHCDTPIDATRHMFSAKDNRPIVVARHVPTSKVFIAQVLPFDRVTSKLLTQWLFSIYSEVV